MVPREGGVSADGNRPTDELSALGETLTDRSRWPVSRIMNSEILTCRPDTGLDVAAGLMTQRGCSSILVVDDEERVVGIWTERDALAVDLEDEAGMTVAISKVMSSPVRSVPATATIEDVITNFRDGSIRHYVVVEGERPVGVVSQTDIVRNQGLNTFLTLRDIGSMVRRTPLLVAGEETVSAVASLMRRATGDAAIVMVDDAPFGILTERDVLRFIAHRLAGHRAREVCARPLLTVPRTTPVIHAHDLMERNHVRHLVVVDEASGEVVSVLSFADILGAIELDYSRYLHAALARQNATIKAKEERQRQIIAATQEGYLELDTDGRVVAVNAAMERLLGVSESSLVGRSPADLVMPECRDAQADQIRRIPDTRHRRYEVDFRHRDGHAVPVRVNATTLCDSTGRITGSFGFLTDLSDKREAERQMNALVDKVSRSNAELEAFAYVISHDLQEPLRMIASYLRLVERRYRDKLDDEGVEFIDFAVDGAKRMQSMITDLLDYSRIDRRGHAFERSDTGACVTLALRHLTAALEEADAVVETDALPALKADDSQLARLFQNLIGNAIKYRHPDRPPHIRIGARRGDAGDDWLFWVRDNGIGIDPAFADRVFRMFQRLHTRDQYSGNGIGLAVCKRIVERHGGTIWIEGHPDEGATVWFTLPENPASRGIVP